MAGTAALRVNESCPFADRDLLARGPLHARRQLRIRPGEGERLDEVVKRVKRIGEASGGGEVSKCVRVEFVKGTSRGI